MSRAVQVLTLLLAFSWPLAAQEMTPEDKADRVTAFHYFDVGNHVQALPLLERLAARYPKDADIHLRYGFALLGYSATIQDPEQRRAARARAHKIGLETQALGDKSNLLTALLDIPEDGRIAAFSGSKAADGAMQAAEADFARGDLQKAIDGYKIALTQDPSLYEAALFIGDCYFKLDQFDTAGPWFDRAIQINPDRETAYRYWGDTLLKAGYPEEARLKFIEAVIAEPYTRSSSIGITQFLDRYKTGLHAPKLKEGAAASVKDDKNISITLDSSAPEGPESAGWLAYAMSRAL